MLSLENRPNSSSWMAFCSPLLAVLLTMLVVGILFALMGTSPWDGLRVFFFEPIKDQHGWAEVGLKVIPLLLISVGLAICFRANIFNIGAEGQLIVGAIFAGAFILQFDSGDNGGFWWVSGALICGVLGGMFWAGITAFLRDYFNTNEILVSLMLVYVAQHLLSFLVHGALMDPDGFGFPQSSLFNDGFLLPALIDGTRLNVAIVLSGLAAIVAWVYLNRSMPGFRLRVGGMAPLAARYAGFSSRRALWISLLASGGLAGLAGAAEVMGPIGQLTPSVSPGYGFAAIIVAFVGRLHPIGVIFSSFIMALIYIGGELAQSRLGMPNAISGIFQGILLFSLLICDVFITKRLVWRK